MRAPMAANLDSSCIAFISFDLWFQTEAHRTKREIQFHRADSDDTTWFVALAKEQLALGTDDGLHGFPFVEGFSVSDFQSFSFLEVVVPRGNAPRSSAYQAGALLLSYETCACARPLFENWRKASVMLRPRLAPILFSRQVQPAFICLPSVKLLFLILFVILLSLLCWSRQERSEQD